MLNNDATFFTLIFSLNKTSNPEPWERVDPSKSQKVEYVTLHKVYRGWMVVNKAFSFIVFVLHVEYFSLYRQFAESLKEPCSQISASLLL